MKETTEKDLTEFINKIAVKKESLLDYEEAKNQCWHSKFDGSYITLDGMEGWKSTFQLYLKCGITEQIQKSGHTPKGEDGVASLGFNPVEQKWYGWSHRALYGFGIGSECKEGDCGYVPYDEQDAIKAAVRFWTEDSHVDTKGKIAEDEEGIRGIKITWTYSGDIPNEKLRCTQDGSFMYFPDTWGKGEWKAETLEDAKQMAIDFADGVS